MKKLQFIIISMSVALILSSCATTYQYVTLPDQNKNLEDTASARIYVMRPAFMATAISMKVAENDTLIGSTGPKGFLCWETTPSDKMLESTSENTSKLELKVEKGKVYFVHQHVLMGILYARNSLELITDEQKAQKLLKKCKKPVIKSGKK